VKEGRSDENWAKDSQAGKSAASKGDYQTAVRFHSRALQEAVRFGDNDPRLIQSLNNLGDAFEHERRLGEAQITYIAALKREQKLFGPDSMSLVPTLDSINRVTCADGRCGSALPYLKQLLSIRKKNLGPFDRDSLATMQMLAETYEKEGKLDQALKCFEEKTAIVKTHFASDDLVVLNCSANLARVLIKRKEYGKAEKLLKHMLLVEEKYDWTNSPIVDSTIRNYRDVLRLTGRSGQAAGIVYRPKKKTKFFF
jgi:tetratricopeptide (TPR) repeat protein